jgi:hypothetical protein
MQDSKEMNTAAAQTKLSSDAWRASSAAGPWQDTLGDAGQKSLQTPLGIILTAGMVALAVVMMASLMFMLI